MSFCDSHNAWVLAAFLPLMAATSAATLLQWLLGHISFEADAMASIVILPGAILGFRWLRRRCNKGRWSQDWRVIAAGVVLLAAGAAWAVFFAGFWHAIPAGLGLTVALLGVPDAR